MALPTYPLVARCRLVGGAEESSLGTNMAASVTAPLAATELLEPAELKIGDIFAEGVRRPVGMGGGRGKPVKGVQFGTLRMKIAMRYGDQCLPMQTACGWRNDSGTYKLYSDLQYWKTWTFVLWEGGSTTASDGRKFVLYGCSGDFTDEAEYTKEVVRTYEFTGLLVQPVAAAMPTNPTLSGLPYLARIGALTIAGAAAPVTRGFTFRNGAAVFPRGDLNAASDAGVAHYAVDPSARNPLLILPQEAHKIADHDPYDYMIDGTAKAIVLSAGDGSHTITYTIGGGIYVNLEPGEADGRSLDTVTIQPTDVTNPDDAMTIAAA